MQTDSVNKRLRVAIDHFKAGAKSSQIKGLGGDWLATDLTVDYTRGSLELKLSPLFEVGPAEKESGGKPLELEGLKFKAVAGGVSIDGPAAGYGQPAYGLSWAGVSALVNWLAVEFDKRKGGPTPTAMGAWRRGLSPEALTAAVWSGEGLPPVGTVCQVQDADGDWHECQIIAHHLHNAVFVPHAAYPYGVYDGLPADRFRPLRTAEQLAAEARDAEVKRLCAVVEAHPEYNDYNLNLGCSAALRFAVEAIVDNHKTAGLGE